MNPPNQDAPASIVLTFSCNDKPGIVADVTNMFALQGLNIRASSQFEDPHTRRFFMRSVFEFTGQHHTVESIKLSFKPLAEKYAMSWDIHDETIKPKVLLAVSQWEHCLSHLLNNWRKGTLPVDIVGVFSNHETLRPLCDWYQLPFHYLPVSKETKAKQEQQVLDLMQSSGAEFLVLARYMQILSDNLCKQLSGKAINIHHSFLPGFKGAKPYHQAYDRGVKLIGATAHYVTADLDEGPIIEQNVERVTHANSPEELVEIGQDIEAIVLNRAVKWHAEHRILMNGDKTVVFDR